MNNSIKRLICAFVCIVLSFVLCSCSVVQNYVDSLTSTKTTASITTTQATTQSVTKKPLKYNTYSLVFKSLTEEQKAVYNQLANQVSDRSKSDYQIKNCTEDDLLKGYKAYQLDNPQYMWLSSGYAYTTVDNRNFKVTPNLFDKTITDYWDMYDKVKMVVKGIVDEASKLSSDYEKALFVHDYIIKHTDYDFDALTQLNKDDFEAKRFYPSSTAYGTFVDKKAVCSGITSAFQIVMTSLDIECGMVNGTKKDGSAHGWNYVNLDGDYYYIDVTWDLPSSDNSNNDKSDLSHIYFCINTDELLCSHNIASGEIVPECTETKLNYFVQNDLYMPSYDYEKTASIIKKQDCQDVYIKYGSEQEAKKAQQDLIEKKKIFSIQNNIDSITWYQDNCFLYMSTQ